MTIWKHIHGSTFLLDITLASFNQPITQHDRQIIAQNTSSITPVVTENKNDLHCIKMSHKQRLRNANNHYQ